MKQNDSLPKPDKQIDYLSVLQTISEQRLFLFGVLTILIIGFHQHFYSGHVADFFHAYGQLGVDGFFFLSGMGIAFSLKKRGSIWTFYQKRVLRLFPAWLLWFACAVTWAVSHGTPVQLKALCALFLFPWFLPSILIFYLISPILLFLLNRWKIYALVGTFLISVGCSYFIDYQDAAHFNTLAIPRLPAYTLGLYMYSAGFSKTKTAQRVLFLFATLSLYTFIYWLPIALNVQPWAITWASAPLKMSFIFFAGAVPFLLWTISKSVTLLAVFRLDNVINYIGGLSLEIFLWHSWIFHMVSPRISRLHDGGMALVLSIVLALLCSVLSRLLLSFLQRFVQSAASNRA